MTLQGDLDTFALPDVLRLLAGAGKSGHLEVAGDRGRGVAVLCNGGIVGGEVQGAPHASEPADVVFELLRFVDGSFCFDGDPDVVAVGWEPTDVDELLALAQDMLAEWSEVEFVVPSLDAWLTLAPEITSDEITVSRRDWQMLATLAGGASVRALADRLELTELAVCRVVRDLVDAGTVVVDTEPTNVVAEPAAVVAEDLNVSARERLDAMAASFAADEAAAVPAADLLPEPLPGAGTAFDSVDRFARRETLAEELAPLESLGLDGDVDGDVVRGGTDEADAHQDDGDGEGEDSGAERGPLVRFLSSVKT